MTSPRPLCSTLFAGGRYRLVAFLSRFGEVVYFVHDQTTTAGGTLLPDIIRQASSAEEAVRGLAPEAVLESAIRRLERHLELAREREEVR